VKQRSVYEEAETRRRGGEWGGGKRGGLQ